MQMPLKKLGNAMESTVLYSIIRIQGLMSGVLGVRL